jgi:hypothetical protein
MKRSFLFVLVAVLLLLTSGPLRAQEHFLGTRKLNVAKSKFPAGTAPKNETRPVEASGGGQKYTLEGTAADGSKISYTFTTKYDGKPVPITSSAPAPRVDPTRLSSGWWT